MEIDETNTVNKKDMLTIDEKQKGGDFLGKGAFGCVVNPPLKCRRPLYKVPYSIDKRFISKIVEYDPDDEDLLNEIEFGHRILQIDPNQKYFTPIMTACLLEYQKHKNIQYKSSKDSESNFSSSSSSSKTGSKKSNSKCVLFKNEEYMNFISKFGGREVKHVLRSVPTDRSRMYIQNNYKKVMKHLCQAIYLLHKNQILHKDIKPNNMLMKIHQRRDQAAITLIDFGLSEIFEKSEYTLGNFQYKIGGGTRSYTPPEVIIIISMADVIRKHKHVIPINFKKLVNEKIDRRYHSATRYFNENMGLVKDGLVSKEERIKYRLGVFPKSRGEFFDKEARKSIFTNLVKEYNDDNLIKNFTKQFGDIYKWDVFSLGLVFVKIVREYEIEDKLCYDLINKMIHIDYTKRLTSVECLAHPFFTKNTKSSKTYIKKNKPRTNIVTKQPSRVSKIKRNKKMMKLLINSKKTTSSKKKSKKKSHKKNS